MYNQKMRIRNRKKESYASRGVFAMSHEAGIPLVLPLADASATLSQVGGKGASLARMAAAGLPVPPGFHITTAAYRRFVSANDLQETILDTVASANPDDPATLENASQRIGTLFADATIPSEQG
jgi:phosphoenolpyruvate synthase/pyruvate phosphate dikinase